MNHTEAVHLRKPANGSTAGIEAEEGGCGVTGFACNIPVSGRHIFEPSVQMHNRGNGKGGGLAAVGLVPEKLGVDQKTLDSDFLLQIALLDETVLPELEARFIRPLLQGRPRSFHRDHRRLPGHPRPRGKAPAGKTLFCPGEAGSPGPLPEGAGPQRCSPPIRRRKSSSIRIPIS